MTTGFVAIPKAPSFRLRRGRVPASLLDMTLPGPPVQAVTPLDFSHTAELVEASYLASAAFLTSVEIAGAGLYGHPSHG